MDTPSIDTIVHTPAAELVVTMSQSTHPDGPQERPAKLKGRKRLLAGLQRISSSPSLVKLGRSTSGGYTSSGRGSMSCISLASANYHQSLAYGSSFSLDTSAQYSTAPTSAAGTPLPATPRLEYFGRPRGRTIGKDTPGSVGLPAEVSRLGTSHGLQDIEGDYFSRPITLKQKQRKRRENFNFWHDLPPELRTEVFTYLTPKEVVRCSSVSRMWHKMCFDGQLWSNLDTANYYHDIPADSLVKIISSAGPFVRDLNLRGCVQLKERWAHQGFVDACRNLENVSLEGCIIDRSSIHCFLLQNSRLVHINLTGLANADNATMKIIGQHCSKMEHLNITWCQRIDTRGLRHVIAGCPRLKDLRTGEITGWDDTSVMLELFKQNTLERLVLMNCDTLTDEALAMLVEGAEPEMDLLTNRPNVPARRLKHLDLTRCRSLSDDGIKKLAYNVPDLEGLQLSKNPALTDASLTKLLPTLPNLTHLDLEELSELTNETLTCISTAPCRSTLQHLSISYCESLGDSGMLPVIKACNRLQSLEMDNTRISDLVLTEAAAMVRSRNKLIGRGLKVRERPSVGLRIVAYDCANVTWTGVREILSRNTEPTKVSLPAPVAPIETAITEPRSPCPETPTTSSESLASYGPTSPQSQQQQKQPPSSPSVPPPAGHQVTILHHQNLRQKPQQQQPLYIQTYPSQIIQLKCFYNWQPTVEEHTKRVLRGDFPAAARLERKWAEWMVLNEEAGAGGGRRRRRRAREAQMMHADEEILGLDGHGEEGGVGFLFGGTAGGGVTGMVGGRRRRARSGPVNGVNAGSGCSIM